MIASDVPLKNLRKLSERARPPLIDYIASRVSLLRRSVPHVPILILASSKDTDDAIRALRAGATSYVSCAAAISELLTAIETTCRGERYLGIGVATALSNRLVLGQRRKHADLSNREMQILIRLAQGRRLKDTAEELCLSVKTVSTYRSRLLEKMGFTSNADITQYALAHSLITSDVIATSGHMSEPFTPSDADRLPPPQGGTFLQSPPRKSYE
ncbi:LuxR C-terminal-related transcriptional regulator [Burkholderia gladioli]|uniref:LuxR C-terminal-related transcriptional regulator n=1 Tax=Burkholderia gladioli TaxID=28095 RepID=UPI001641080E|nr:response regulator transcription factor [Burkholderia gladioli]